MIHRVRSLSVVNDAEADVLWDFPCSPHDLTNLGYLIFGSSASSKPKLYIWKFLAQVLLKRSLKEFSKQEVSEIGDNLSGEA